MKEKQTQEQLIIGLDRIRQSHEEWVAGDLKRRKEFARAFGWNKAKRQYDYGDAELYEPTWVEIFVKLGKLLATRDFYDLEENVSELEFKLQELENKIKHDCFILTGKHKNIMESEINKRIRETLDKYGVMTNGQEKNYLHNLVEALSIVFWDNRKEHYARVLSMVDSHGFMQFLLGEYEYKEIKKPTITEKCSHEWTEVEGNGDWNEQCMSCKALREWRFQK